MKITDWNGREVEAAQSRGGVLALANFSDNLLRDNSRLWPRAAVVQKLHESKAGAHFDAKARTILTRKLGYYCDLQSLHSEDAITWSIFGTLASAPEADRVKCFNWLLKVLRLSGKNSRCSISLWRRVPHPDKPIAAGGGPELDFLLQGDECAVFGEAKWRSSEALQQGVSKHKGQQQLRYEFLQKYGGRVFGRKNFLVLNVVLHQKKTPEAFEEWFLAGSGGSKAGNVIMRTIHWATICENPHHPKAEEVRRYYNWKRSRMKAERGWAEGIVNPDGDHIRLCHGKDPTTIARLARGPGEIFSVQFLSAPAADVRTAQIREDVRRELDFYLIEHVWPDPWAYAQYHCYTAANVYSKVHWGWYPKGPKRSSEPHSSRVIRRGGRKFVFRPARPAP